MSGPWTIEKESLGRKRKARIDIIITVDPDPEGFRLETLRVEGVDSWHVHPVARRAAAWAGGELVSWERAGLRGWG